MYDKYGNSLGLYLFYDAAIKCFGEEHLLYAILAIVITLLFNVLPLLLLLLYPLHCFQRCLSICRLRWHGLHIFIDAFHGCYKNGTLAGTRDCRYFAAASVPHCQDSTANCICSNTKCTLLCSGIIDTDSTCNYSCHHSALQTRPSCLTLLM